MEDHKIDHALKFIIMNSLTPDYVTFGRTLAADELTNVSIESERFLFVANTKKRGENMGHWVVIEIINFKEVEFFDSLGQCPTGLIEDFISKFKKRSHNQIPLQHIGSPACGAYCIFYAYCRYKNISQNVEDFVSSYIHNCGTPIMYVPSEARDFDLMQSIFLYSKILITPINSVNLYQWHLFGYFHLPMPKDHIILALSKFKDESPGSFGITIGGVITVDELDALFEKNVKLENIYIVNTSKRREEQGRWVLIEIQNRNEVEYFDPLGRPPEGLIKDFISKFKKTDHNKITIKHWSTRTSGAYCIVYAFMRFINLPKDYIIHTFISKNYKNLCDTSLSISRDFSFYCEVYNKIGISILPLQDSSPLFWRMFMPMSEYQIKYALETMIKYKKRGYVEIRGVIRADELHEVNLELEKVVYVVNLSKRGEELGRWILIEIKNRNEVEFFDSLENPAEGLIANFLSKLKKLPNKQALQHDETKISGAYCIFYAYMRYKWNKSHAEIVDHFVSLYGNVYSTSPSILRDFYFYQFIFSFFNIPLQQPFVLSHLLKNI